MSFLDNSENSSIIEWEEDGKGFLIQDKKRFAAEILPQVLKQTQYSSFTRRMNRWQFTLDKLGHRQATYRHPLFIRGRKDLALQMKPIRQKQYGQVTKKRSNSECDGDGHEDDDKPTKRHSGNAAQVDSHRSCDDNSSHGDDFLDDNEEDELNTNDPPIQITSSKADLPSPQDSNNLLLNHERKGFEPSLVSSIEHSRPPSNPQIMNFPPHPMRIQTQMQDRRQMYALNHSYPQSQMTDATRDPYFANPIWNPHQAQPQNGLQMPSQPYPMHRTIMYPPPLNHPMFSNAHINHIVPNYQHMNKTISHDPSQQQLASQQNRPQSQPLAKQTPSLFDRLNENPLKILPSNPDHDVSAASIPLGQLNQDNDAQNQSESSKGLIEYHQKFKDYFVQYQTFFVKNMEISNKVVDDYLERSVGETSTTL